MSRNFDGGNVHQPLGGGQMEHGHNEPMHQVQAPYKFTPDEIRVLKECNRESFWYRSLPLCTAMSTGVYFGTKAGYIKPSVRWGAWPKISLAVTFGYFLGKFSYQTKCIEKIMQLPNSPLAEMLRQKSGRGLIAAETMSMEPGFYSTAPAADSAPSSTEPVINMDVMDVRPISTFDTEASNFVGFDAAGKTDSTDQMLDDDNLPGPKAPLFSTTYDDLRRQNRIEYETQRHPSTIISKPPTPQDPNRPRPSQVITRDTTSSKIKNAYGDVWDDNPQQ